MTTSATADAEALTARLRWTPYTSKAIATMYVKHVLDNDAEICAPMLGGMVLARARRLAAGDIEPGSAEHDSLRGQMIGFAHVLSKWLFAAVRHMGDSFNSNRSSSAPARSTGSGTRIGFSPE